MIKQLRRLWQSALLHKGGGARKKSEENTEAEAVPLLHRLFGRNTGNTFCLLLLLAITLSSLLTACGSSPPKSQDTNQAYKASTPVNPTTCSVDSSASASTSNTSCFEPNAITCVDGNSCYTCSTYNCVPYPQGLNIEDDIELPLWQHNSLFVTTPLNLTAQLPLVQATWGWSLGVTDIMALLLITLSGIRVMITGSVFRRAEAATMIPNILLGLIVAHLSMIIIMIFLSMGNALSTDLYMWAGNNLKGQMSMVCDNVPTNSSVQTKWFPPNDPSFANLTGIGELNRPGDSSDTSTSWDHGYPIKWVTTNNNDPAYKAWHDLVNAWVESPAVTARTGLGITQQEATNLTTLNGQPAYPEVQAACHFGGFGGAGNSNVLKDFQDLAETGSGGFWSDLGNAFRDMWNSFDHFIDVLYKISILALLGQMIGRFLIIDFFIGTSPLALGSWGLPGRMGQGLTSAWFRGFTTSVLMQFLQVMALIVGETCLSTIQNTIQASMNLSVTNGDQANTLEYIVGTIFIWFILRIPSMMGSPATNLVMEMGQQGSRTVGAVIGHSMQEGQMVMNGGMMVLGGAMMGI